MKNLKMGNQMNKGGRGKVCVLRGSPNRPIAGASRLFPNHSRFCPEMECFSRARARSPLFFSPRGVGVPPSGGKG